MRTRISNPVLNLKYVFLILSVLFLIFGELQLVVFVFESILSGFDEWNKTIIDLLQSFFCAVIFLVLFLMNHQRHVVEFDAKYLYIIQQGKEKRIDLKSVYKIVKPIWQIGNSLNNWIIVYKEEGGTENIVKVNITLRQEEFEGFKARVKNVNKRVKIK